MVISKLLESIARLQIWLVALFKYPGFLYYEWLMAAYIVFPVILTTAPGRLAQSVGHLARKSGVLGSIPGHILSFLRPLIKEGQLSVTGESMCTKYWLTA